MNLADPDLEFIDPTPNVHSLFIHFDSVFFWTQLAGKAVVRWSKRMFSCAGICSYEGRGGICDIALSEPLLKLRPRKDLVETLLHEMIHAYLFVVGRDQSRDGHGPNFLAHMHRINKAAGLNISIYHDFHDEVRLYKNHVWRCNGPCQKVRPFFGIVRRSNNRAPGPSDYWWNTHKRVCGGTFIKCQEPEKPVKQVKKKNKPSGDITKYINNNNETIKNKNETPMRKSITGFNDLKTNKVETAKPVSKPAVFTGAGKTIGGTKINSNSVGVTVGRAGSKPIVKSPVISSSQPIRRPSSNSSVADTVRNIWANKTLPVAANLTQKPTSNKAANKRMSDVTNSNSQTPPKKYKKIDDYFKTTASNILKDVYGKDFKVTQSDTSKLKAVIVKENLVDCPICNAKVNVEIINSHIDECLNKDVVEKLSKEAILIGSNSSQIKQETKNSRDSFNPLTSEQSRIKNVTVKSEINTQTVGPSIIKTEPKECIDLTHIQIKKEATDRNVNSMDLSQPSTSQLGNFSNTRKTDNEQIKQEPSTNSKFEDNTNQASTSKGTDSNEPNTKVQTCPCCDKAIDKPIQEHLDECLIFFDDNAPQESLGDRTIVIDDSDDEFDETQTLNATGTKSPCPCCMEMIEEREMSNHLDICLGIRD